MTANISKARSNFGGEDETFSAFGGQSSIIGQKRLTVKVPWKKFGRTQKRKIKKGSEK